MYTKNIKLKQVFSGLQHENYCLVHRTEQSTLDGEEGEDKNLVGGIFDDAKIYNVYIS